MKSVKQVNSFSNLCSSLIYLGAGGGGVQKTLEFIYKNLCIYTYMFKFQSPSKYSPFDATHLWRFFSHCSEHFFNSSILMPFSASAIFCFTSSTSAKRFPLGTFFTKGNSKKSLGARSGKQGGWESCCFLVKNC